MRIRRNVRALLRDGGRLVFLRRGRPGGAATKTLTVTEPGARTTVVQHYFRADILTTNPHRRSGPELTDPDLCDFTPVRAARDAPAREALALQPPELAAYAREHRTSWAD